jgi:hypothetical protein
LPKRQKFAPSGHTASFSFLTNVFFYPVFVHIVGWGSSKNDSVDKFIMVAAKSLHAAKVRRVEASFFQFLFSFIYLFIYLFIDFLFPLFLSIF